METIGLIGGMSWESSLHYYKLINEETRARVGGLHSAACVLLSLDFAPIEVMQREGRWGDAAALLGEAAQRLERAGAAFLILCTNTMHKVADELQRQTRLPLIHIADATAASVRRAGLKRVGLLGTRFTMEESFYSGRLTDRHGLEVMVPDAAARAAVHRIIYEELCLGRVETASREIFRQIGLDLVARGAQGVILGCTEIMMLLGDGDLPVAVFDTTAIHAKAAVDRALAADAPAISG